MQAADHVLHGWYILKSLQRNSSPGGWSSLFWRSTTQHEVQIILCSQRKYTGYEYFMPYNYRDIGADYYVANAHKWLFSPKVSIILLSISCLSILLCLHFTSTPSLPPSPPSLGTNNQGCAFLYVDKARQDILRPLVLSWGNGFGMSSDFCYLGMCISPVKSCSPLSDEQQTKLCHQKT